MKDQNNLPQKPSLSSSPLSTPNSPIALSEVSQLKKAPLITNFYIQQLKRIFSKKQQSKHSIDVLTNDFYKSDTYFITDLAQKLTPDDYRALINNLTLMEKNEGICVVQRGKKSQVMYVLLQGQVSYNIKSEVSEEELVRVGTGYPGFVIYPEIFMSPRYVNFSIRCEKSCTFLALNEEIYNKYLKKLVIREVDTIANLLAEVAVFNRMGALNMRKYLSYFIGRCYKYNEVIYSAEDEAEEIFFILQGEVQLYTKNEDNHVNIVNLGQRQCFGLDGENTRKYFSKSVSSQLRVIVLNKKILEVIKSENICVVENCQNYVKKKQKFHGSIVNKNIRILNNKDEVRVKITKRKNKKTKKNKNSLAWWGLAQSVKVQHKYRIPKSVQLIQLTGKVSQDQKSVQTLLTHKINRLKQRILDSEIEEECEVEDQQNNSPYKINNTYVPKIKTRIKMLEVKPKAIDMAQIVKKKLITYARNMGSFCDRLNLQ